MLKKVLISGLLSCFSMHAFAYGDLVDAELPRVYSPIITLSGGAVWTSPGQVVYRYPPMLLPPFFHIDQYNPNSPTTTALSGEIFFGLQSMLTPKMIGELGIGIAGLTDASVTGIVNVDGVPNITAYSYFINHGRVELKGKLIGCSFRFAEPYISGSVGVGINHSHDYREASNNSPLYFTQYFADHSTPAFSYTVGLGIQKKITPHWQLGIGAEVGDLGRSYLGADATSLVSGPYASNFYIGEVLASLSYLY